MNISIVGAGPSGCRVAQLLSESGHNVRVFEEHERVGIPEHCTGIVSPRLLEVVKTRAVVNKIGLARFFGSKTRFSVKGKALVIDRQKFDKERFRAAKRAGAEFFFNTRARFDGKDLILGDHRIYSDVIIGADGARSIIRSFYHPNYSGLLPSAQYLVRGKFDPNNCEIHLWPHYRNKGLFTWVVPQSRKLAKIGLACNNPKQVLDAFMKDRFPRVKIEKVMAGTVLVGGIVRQDFGRVRLVGDAAGHVKATTGGGIVAGLLCAEKLAQSINTGENYSRLCRPVLNQLRLAYLARSVWNKLSPTTKEKILKSMKQDSEYFEKADMDWHSTTLMKFIAKKTHLIPRIFYDLIF